MESVLFSYAGLEDGGRELDRILASGCCAQVSAAQIDCIEATSPLTPRLLFLAELCWQPTTHGVSTQVCLPTASECGILMIFVQLTFHAVCTGQTQSSTRDSCSLRAARKQVHMIVSEDSAMLNTGIFFVRASAWVRNSGSAEYFFGLPAKLGECLRRADA